MWFKHFGRGPDAAGEAYHLGIFGKTGSGKSVLAKMLLLAYARSPNMGILVVDPQGEFSKDIKGQHSGEFQLPLADLFKKVGKENYVMTVRQLILDRWELFAQILFESSFFNRLTMPKGTNRQNACDLIEEKLRNRKITLSGEEKNITLADLHTREAFDATWALLSDDKNQAVIYPSKDARGRFTTALAEANRDDFYANYWHPVTELFRHDRKNARTVDKAIGWLLGDPNKRRVLIIDLSKAQAEGLFWNEDIQSLVIKRLLQGITDVAESEFRNGQDSLNTLVVIDEAHRLAPRDLPVDNDFARGVRGVLIDAARTTRKYGLGWLFISQTLSSLHPEILQQLRIFFFGFGLGLGQEFQSLRQLVGSSSTALDLYQLFRDPHSAFDIASRQYSFMTIGPVSPLSFSGTPLFLNAFNNVDAFLDANGLR